MPEGDWFTASETHHLSNRAVAGEGIEPPSWTYEDLLEPPPV